MKSKGTQQNNIGLVYVDTYSKAIVNPLTTIEKTIAERCDNITKITNLNPNILVEVFPIYCYNTAPKLYCEISGYARGILDGKKYESTKIMGTTVYDLVINGTHDFLIDKLKMLNSERLPIYMFYNTWGKSPPLDVKWLKQKYTSLNNTELNEFYTNIQTEMNDILCKDDKLITLKCLFEKKLENLDFSNFNLKRAILKVTLTKIDRINELIHRYLLMVTKYINKTYEELLNDIKEHQLNSGIMNKIKEALQNLANDKGININNLLVSIRDYYNNNPNLESDINQSTSITTDKDIKINEIQNALSSINITFKDLLEKIKNNVLDTYISDFDTETEV